MQKPFRFVQRELSEVTAVRWVGTNNSGVYKLIGHNNENFRWWEEDFWAIAEEEDDWVKIEVGDWIVKDFEGEFTVVTHESFHQEFERDDNKAVRSITPLGEGLLSPEQACAEALALSSDFRKLVIVYSGEDEIPGVITSGVSYSEIHDVSKFLTLLVETLGYEPSAE